MDPPAMKKLIRSVNYFNQSRAFFNRICYRLSRRGILRECLSCLRQVSLCRVGLSFGIMSR